MSINYKNTNAERTTITRDVEFLDVNTGNIYKAISAISQRSNQISAEMKDELVRKLAEFASTTDNLEEVFENREQIEISRFYERLPKTNAMALKDFLEDKVYYRHPSDSTEEA